MALTSPLLNDNNIEGASNILLYIASGDEEISMDEVTEITDYIQEQAGSTAEIIWGNGTDASLGNKISVTLIATGFFTKPPVEDKIIIGRLDDKPIKQPMKNEQIKDTPDFRIFTQSPDGQRSDSRPSTEFAQTATMNSATTTNSTGTNNPTLFNLDTPSDYSQPLELYPTISEPVISDKQSGGSSRFEQPVSTQKYPINEPTISLDSIERISGERISRLKGLSVHPGTASIEELENQPAYMRRNVELNDAPASDASNISRYSLTLDPETKQVEIRSNNSFLHDKPD